MTIMNRVLNYFNNGYIFMILSALFFCLMTVFVKLAGESVPTIQIVFIRGVITFLFIYIIIIIKGIYLWGSNRFLLSIRGLTGSVALFFVYESIQRFPLSDSTVIQYLYPIFTTLLASVILSESLNKSIIFSVFLGFSGVYIILGMPYIGLESSSFKLSNIIIAIAGSFLTGLAYVLVRLSSNMKESPYIIMFYFPLFTVPLSMPFAFYSWVGPSFKTWIILLFVGIFTMLGQFFLTFSYKLLPASRVAPVSYIQVPFSVLASMIVFKESLSFDFVIGSTIIFLSILIIVNSRVKSI